jgi:hypothetical protein
MANVSVTRKLLVPAVPALPPGPVNYNREYQDELNRVLRLYFQQLGGAFQAYLNEGGGRFLSVPLRVVFFKPERYIVSKRGNCNNS